MQSYEEEDNIQEPGLQEDPGAETWEILFFHIPNADWNINISGERPKFT